MPVALRWYALAYIVGIVLGWRLAVAALRRPRLWAGGAAPMTPAQLEALLTWIILGIIAGGRLGYVLLYRPAALPPEPLGDPGALAGGHVLPRRADRGDPRDPGLLAARRACRSGGVADAIALASPPAILLGRLANFVNAELWGRPTTLPWGVIFPGEAAQDCPGVARPLRPPPLAALRGGARGAAPRASS